MNPQTVLLAITAAEAAFKLYATIREEIERKGEMTPELEQELDSRALKMFTKDHWKV